MISSKNKAKLFLFIFQTRQIAHVVAGRYWFFMFWSTRSEARQRRGRALFAGHFAWFCFALITAASKWSARAHAIAVRVIAVRSHCRVALRRSHTACISIASYKQLLLFLWFSTLRGKYYATLTRSLAIIYAIFMLRSNTKYNFGDILYESTVNSCDVLICVQNCFRKPLLVKDEEH